MKNKHLTLEDRYKIEYGLKDHLSFKKIALDIGRDCTTVSKEIRRSIIYKRVGAFNKKFNECIHRYDCKHTNTASSKCSQRKVRKCSFCARCCNPKICPDFKLEVCHKLSKAPYVCNGCKMKTKCTLEKRYYSAKEAQAEYEERLSEARKGYIVTEDEIKRLNDIFYDLVVNKGQSIHHVFINHKDEIMMSEKKVYNLIDDCVLNVKNIDLPRKVRFKARRKKSSSYKVDRKCLLDRRYEDFNTYMETNDVNIVQMDTVEGRKGGKCILTIHFTSCAFMIAFIRDYNDSKSVTKIYHDLYKLFGHDMYIKLFPVILTDNGSEFSNPLAIETNENGDNLSRVFYCHPGAPYEKGSCEVNHQLIRRVIPKGTSMDGYSQKDINLMMSHVNSYARPRLNDQTPFELFKMIYGREIIDALGIEFIKPDDINLTPDLLK